jgi:tRNA threonylcarbamoyladenosine biosynthesis protein TsaE
MQACKPFKTVTHLNNLEQTAKEVISYASPCKTWLFTGNLGAGKTTLIKAICKQLGVTEYVASPTFSLINTYHLSSGTLIHHIDAYRLVDMQEVIEMDFPFYFETGYCFIEWPSKIPQDLIPVPHINIELTHHHTHDDIRTLHVEWITSIC